jgi:hypothetical protein
MTINNVAICYYGMPRSIKSVYKSHQQFLFNVFKDNYMRYEIFMHTWDIGKYNIIKDKITDVPVDYQEYKLLNPKYYQIDNQKEFVNTINIEDYFSSDLYAKNGNTVKGEWNPKLIYNRICSLESIKRVTMMVEITNISRFDAIIYIRPDMLLNNEFSLNWFIYFNPGQLMLLNYDHNEGYNDKFAVLHLENYKAFGYRIDKLKEYREKMGRITPEKFLKYIVLRNYKQIKFIDLDVKIIRPDIKRNYGNENINSIDFKSLISMNSVNSAYKKLITDVFSITENKSIKIEFGGINSDGRDDYIYYIYKDGKWNKNNWNEISNYLYNRYIFYLKNNFEKIKKELSKDTIISYNKFFHLALLDRSIESINNELLEFFIGYQDKN